MAKDVRLDLGRYVQNPFNRKPILDKWNGLTDKLASIKN